MRLSAIISTYNSPQFLRWVLMAYGRQNFSDFEIVVADDGSGEETRKVVELFRDQQQFTIQHVWHPDEGFRKPRILNKAIEASTGEYLVFSDGDCVAHPDFLKAHAENAIPGTFLSGGTENLASRLCEKLTDDDILGGNLFDRSWLKRNGNPTRVVSKVRHEGMLRRLLNQFTPTKRSFNGHNSSAWKQDILRINGFDERMVYGGLDRELGERLHNIGVRGRGVRFKAVCVHLDHPRPYKTRSGIENNNAIRKATRQLETTWTDYGIARSADGQSEEGQSQSNYANGPISRLAGIHED